MSDQDVFNKILEERGEVDITPTSSTITVKVQSDLVAETVDTDGNPLR